jgi:hypothetical protein
MAYLNGLDMSVILPALTGRIGWRSESPDIASFESFHSLCTEDNLRATQPDADITELEFTALKETLAAENIQRTLLAVFSKPEQIQQVLLHNRLPGSLRTTIDNSGEFRGLRFTIAKDFGIANQVKTVTLVFDGVRTFNLYLFKEGTAAPIETKEVTTVANTPTVIDLEAEGWIMNYPASGECVYYLGYFQDDLAAVKAVREQVRFNHTICFSAECISAQPLTSSTFNQEQISYNSYDANGINAEVHSFRDYTYKVKRSAQLFDELIGLQMVVKVLEQIVSSTRSNITERILKEGFDKAQLVHYLNGAVPISGAASTKGLRGVVADKIEAVRNAFFPKSKISIVCS